MGVQSYRVVKLISEVEGGRLEAKPFFQRRQVWTNRDKEFFIDTILNEYPFPEIFIATGSLDRKKLQLRMWLVDGQQRVTTLIDYFRGSPYLVFKKVKRYEDLTTAEQDSFLNYEVAVRDLGTVNEDEIREIFRRINSTDYALKSMEVLNAMFSGRYKQYCEALSRHPFFEEHNVFPPAYRKRMYDLTFCVILVTTILAGYYRRDERNEEYLKRYNDEFSLDTRVQAELDFVFDFVERCGFGKDSRAWRQTDLFTLLVELHTTMVVQGQPLDPAVVGPILNEFFGQVERLYSGSKIPDEGQVPTGQEQFFRYLKAATKATNDKYARIERAAVISELLLSTVSASDDAGARESGRPPAPAPGDEKTADRPRPKAQAKSSKAKSQSKAKTPPKKSGGPDG